MLTTVPAGGLTILSYPWTPSRFQFIHGFYVLWISEDTGAGRSFLLPLLAAATQQGCHEASHIAVEPAQRHTIREAFRDPFNVRITHFLGYTRSSSRVPFMQRASTCGRPERFVRLRAGCWPGATMSEICWSSGC